MQTGDPARTVSGRQDYMITYRVQGALDGFADHDELTWNTIGTKCEVPIDHASVRCSCPPR